MGHNGSPQIINYANGFAAAARVLIDQVIRARGIKLHVDEFIYPICFSIRHAVELHLKATIEKLYVIGSLKGGASLPELKLAFTHDLGVVWSYITEHGPRLDKRYRSRLACLSEFIDDIARIDATGQVFRYPFDTENQKHLEQVSTISVTILRERFDRLESLLADLAFLNDELIAEYNCGSFTSKLSRLELFEIASKLLKRSLWGSEEFVQNKAAICQEYALSSNDFSRALNVIQANYEMSQLIDAVASLQAVTVPALLAFFDGWACLHDIEQLRNPNPISLYISNEESITEIEEILEGAAKREGIWSKLNGVITSSQLAELTALFYFRDNMQYSEHFVMDRESKEKKPNLSPEGFKDAIFHLLDKRSAFTNILNSLNFLGQTTAVQILLKRYSLDRSKDRLLKGSIRASRRLMEQRGKEAALALR